MAELLSTTGEMCLLHPDGHKVVSGSGTIVASEHRLEVRISVGRPFWIEYASIAEVELVGGTLPLVLDSGHTVRLSSLATPDRLSGIVVEGRRSELSAKLRLPGREARLETEGVVEWSEHGWVAQVDAASVVVDNTHLTVVPDHHRPFAVPLQWLRSVTRASASIAAEAERSTLRMRIALGADDEASEFVDAVAESKERLRAGLTERLGPGLAPWAVGPLASGSSLTQADLEDPGSGGAPEGSWRALLDALCAEPARGALAILDRLARSGEMRVGVSSVPAPDGHCEPIAWVLAPAVGRGTPGPTLVHVLTHEAPATVAFAVSDISSGPLVALEQACGALAPDFRPLGLTDIDLANADGGAWLWPVRHLEPLVQARRLFAGQALTEDPAAWSRELLALLTRR